MSVESRVGFSLERDSRLAVHCNFCAPRRTEAALPDSADACGANRVFGVEHSAPKVDSLLCSRTPRRDAVRADRLRAFPNIAARHRRHADAHA